MVARKTERIPAVPEVVRGNGTHREPPKSLPAAPVCSSDLSSYARPFFKICSHALASVELFATWVRLSVLITAFSFLSLALFVCALVGKDEAMRDQRAMLRARRRK